MATTFEAIILLVSLAGILFAAIVIYFWPQIRDERKFIKIYYDKIYYHLDGSIASVTLLCGCELHRGRHISTDKQWFLVLDYSKCDSQGCKDGKLKIF